MYLAVNAVIGLAWLLPAAKRRLPHSHMLLSTWSRKLPPARATPFTGLIVLALAGAALEVGWVDIAALLLLGFDTFMRSGELFVLAPRDILFKDDKAVITIRDSKMGVRQGFQEIVMLRPGISVQVLFMLCQRRPREAPLLAGSPAQARGRLQALLALFGLEGLGFAFYSLRRGGATAFYARTGNLEQTLLQGRWASTKTARLYLTQSVADVVAIGLTDTQKGLLRAGVDLLAAKADDLTGWGQGLGNRGEAWDF